MPDPITLSLIAAGASSLIGGVGSAVKNRQAKNEENRLYGWMKDSLNTEYYRDPLSTLGNRSLLKSFNQRMKDNTDAINNRAIAGGATFENQLAARQAGNEATDRFYTSLLQTEDARRQGVDRQKRSLEQQHSANLQAQLAQGAQDWKNWGAAMGDAVMAWGNAKLLG